MKLGVRIAPLQPSSLPVWQGSCFPVLTKPEAIVMIHPIVRNYYHIRMIEERTGRIAIAKVGYIELVKA